MLRPNPLLFITSGRHTPLKTWEPRIIVIASDPFAAGFNGECHKPRVRYQVATSVCFCAKALENLPVALARLNDYAVGLSKDYVAEPEHFIQAAGYR